MSALHNSALDETVTSYLKKGVSVSERLFLGLTSAVLIASSVLKEL